MRYDWEPKPFDWSGVLTAMIVLFSMIAMRTATAGTYDPCADLKPDPLGINTPGGCTAPELEIIDPDDPLGIRGSLR
ncbi:MAG: hypothetical protein MJH10_10505 [Epibacterium sp.]|nr:hypothetical protein [Epibacterium sp.]NQX73971.1 hypothetical protein [Epibacterium sp.]